MEFATNHQPSEWGGDHYGLRINEQDEDLGLNNSAEVAIWFEEFIDSRSELNLEIRKRSLAFLKRAVAQLEEELSGK